jgi:hypothetical protein
MWVSLEPRNLRRGLGFNLAVERGSVGPWSAGIESAQERRQGWAEASADRVGQAGNLAEGRERGLAVDQDHVAADAERGRSEGDVDGLFGSCALGHERGAGERAHCMQLAHGAVHAPRKSEIICVDNQPAHGPSVSTGRQRAE